jgi:hypothetical protein
VKSPAMAVPGSPGPASVQRVMWSTYEWGKIPV